jgi:hypothetical protein
MKRSNGWSAVATSLWVVSALGASAFAQEAAKHAVTSTNKVLVDNGRVIAGEATWAPGTQNANVARPARIIRGLSGGTLTVIYADGRTEKRTFEPGAVYYFEPDTVANYLRNDGTSEVKVYYVFLK